MNTQWAQYQWVRNRRNSSAAHYRTRCAGERRRLVRPHLLADHESASSLIRDATDDGSTSVFTSGAAANIESDLLSPNVSEWLTRAASTGRRAWDR